MISDLAALQTALIQNFFEHIPNDGVGLTAAAVAEKAGMDEYRTTRILKILATHRIFEETAVAGADGKFRHTASSDYLKTSVFAAMCDMVLDDAFKAAPEVHTWVAKAPHAESMGKEDSPFYQRFGKTFYDFNDTVPGKAARFSNAMAG